MPKKVLTKKDVIKESIDAQKYEIFKNEIAAAYQASLKTPEGDKQVAAAEHNIEEANKRMYFLMELITKE